MGNAVLVDYYTKEIDKFEREKAKKKQQLDR